MTDVKKTISKKTFLLKNNKKFIVYFFNLIGYKNLLFTPCMLFIVLSAMLRGVINLTIEISGEFYTNDFKVDQYKMAINLDEGMNNQEFQRLIKKVAISYQRFAKLRPLPESFSGKYLNSSCNETTYSLNPIIVVTVNNKLISARRLKILKIMFMITRLQLQNWAIIDIFDEKIEKYLKKRFNVKPKYPMCKDVTRKRLLKLKDACVVLKRYKKQSVLHLAKHFMMYYTSENLSLHFTDMYNFLLADDEMIFECDEKIISVICLVKLHILVDFVFSYDELMFLKHLY
ncbi:hypothetical protein AAJ76_1030001592 [Vairimorpha ceranae]|uniref:Uncharacterized protein n=1 Tax=Vairimorpha ceranae TaxID=40302 RepID=A0A0F9WMA4_9MICR|nr:hypothetical protein AAJ76_1030001592 [Vairimorpha ceranae]KKO74193.1 hypothetical protein AAJ76_1030001592 [Vairimorpha ceranae]